MPDGLLTAWNPDPAAMALCAAILIAYRRGNQPAARLPLGLSLLLIAVLFISPLCALTTALFSVRVVHHVLLVTVVAPLLALVFPARRAGRISLTWLVAAHAAILWFWHVPAAYEEGVNDAIAYWAMQTSLLGSAFLMWRRILAPDTALAPALFSLLATTVQMGMLGALLTFASRPLYALHLTSTVPYGLTPLADQQLAGMVMWVPAALPYLVAALLLFIRQMPAMPPRTRPAR